MSRIRILDLRDLAQEWRDELKDDGAEATDVSYRALCSQLGIDETPDALEHFANDFEPTLIADSYFEKYAEELADDIGVIDSNAGWPLYCIDWERAANDLKQDYSSISFDGEDYWIRS